LLSLLAFLLENQPILFDIPANIFNIADFYKSFFAQAQRRIK